MKAEIQTILVAPIEQARHTLGAFLHGVRGLRIRNVATSYDATPDLLDQGPVDLVVVDLDADPARSLTLIQNLVRLRPELAVLPASRGREADLILRAIRAGAREFLTYPTSREELEAAIDRLLSAGGAQGGPGSPSRLVALAGAAGGIGCTTLAVNLAVALARSGTQETALVDFDLVMGAVDVCLDLAPVQSLADLARNVDRLDPMLLKRSLTRHASGLYVLPGPPSLAEAATIEPESLRKVLQILRSLFPIVIVDMGKALQLTDLVALEQADTILLVIQLEPVCLRNTVRMLEDLQPHIEGFAERVQIVANRVGSSPFEIGTKQAQELLKRPINWSLIDSPKLFASARSKGVPVEQEAAGSRLHRAMVDLARSVMPTAIDVDRKQSRLGRFAASFF